MDIEKILGMIDHTNLKQDATWNDIMSLCDEGIKYRVASVCIPPSFVKQAVEYTEDKLTICTVIGFPNGYNTTAAKCFEAAEAVNNGAGEIDMVINIGWLKEGRYDELLEEIRLVKKSCRGKLLKVIIEACLLTDEEKIKMCGIISNSGAEFIKTSTGFSTGGATRDDIALFKKNVASHVKIKAAGGIRSLDDAHDFIALGADRLGTSAIIRLIKNQ